MLAIVDDARLAVRVIEPEHEAEGLAQDIESERQGRQRWPTISRSCSARSSVWKPNSSSSTPSDDAPIGDLWTQCIRRQSQRGAISIGASTHLLEVRCRCAEALV